MCRSSLRVSNYLPLTGDCLHASDIPEPPSPADRTAPPTEPSTATDAAIASSEQLTQLLKPDAELLRPMRSGSLASLHSGSPVAAAPGNPASSDFNCLARGFTPQGAAALLGTYQLSPDLGVGDTLVQTSGGRSQLSSGDAFYLRDATQHLGLSADSASLFWHQQHQMLQQEQAWWAHSRLEQQQMQATLSGLPGVGGLGQGGLPGMGGAGQSGLPELRQANMQPDLEALSMCALANALPDWASPGQLQGSRPPLTQINPWQGTIPGRSPEPHFPD